MYAGKLIGPLYKCDKQKITFSIYKNILGSHLSLSIHYFILFYVILSMGGLVSCVLPPAGISVYIGSINS